MSNETTAAREAARQSDGKFGEQGKADPGQIEMSTHALKIDPERIDEGMVTAACDTMDDTIETYGAYRQDVEDSMWDALRDASQQDNDQAAVDAATDRMSWLCRDYGMYRGDLEDAMWDAVTTASQNQGKQ